MYKKGSLDFHSIWQIGCTKKSAPKMWIEAVYYLLWSDMLFINFLRATGGVTLYERFFLL